MGTFSYLPLDQLLEKIGLNHSQWHKLPSIERNVYAILAGLEAAGLYDIANALPAHIIEDEYVPDESAYYRSLTDYFASHNIEAPWMATGNREQLPVEV